MTETIVAIGTRKGLWIARSDDRSTWSLEGPHFLMSEVASVAIDT
ncbi:MAG TPA: exo-alpha-sialidase, partial [Humibacillus xanthopallidus]|nr:exo-alpha-sialidase [Humibacillus xanthopallidus]